MSNCRVDSQMLHQTYIHSLSLKFLIQCFVVTAGRKWGLITWSVICADWYFQFRYCVHSQDKGNPLQTTTSCCVSFRTVFNTLGYRLAHSLHVNWDTGLRIHDIEFFGQQKTILWSCVIHAIHTTLALIIGLHWLASSDNKSTQQVAWISTVCMLPWILQLNFCFFKVIN